jgi:hypothetical protein
VGSSGNERQVTNVAAGTQATDAVNKAQLDAVASTATTTSRFFQASGNGDDVAGALVEGDNALAAGDAANAIGNGATALGSGANALAGNAQAIGFNALATAANASAVGANAQATVRHRAGCGKRGQR